MKTPNTKTALALLAAAGLTLSSIVFADETAPVIPQGQTQNTVQPGMKGESRAKMHALKAKIKADKQKLRADRKQFGLSSSQVAADKAALKSDIQARKELKEQFRKNRKARNQNSQGVPVSQS